MGGKLPGFSLPSGPGTGSEEGPRGDPSIWGAEASGDARMLVLEINSSSRVCIKLVLPAAAAEGVASPDPWPAWLDWLGGTTGEEGGAAGGCPWPFFLSALDFLAAGVGFLGCIVKVLEFGHRTTIHGDHTKEKFTEHTNEIIRGNLEVICGDKSATGVYK